MIICGAGPSSPPPSRLRYLRRAMQRAKRPSLGARLARYWKLHSLHLLPEDEVRRISGFDPSEYQPDMARWEHLRKVIQIDWNSTTRKTEVFRVEPHQPEGSA